VSDQAGAGSDRESLVKLRFDFVELLFALATAEVAIQIGLLASVHRTLLDAPTAYSHLILALVLIATSWVGWSRSSSAGNRLPLENVFTLAFVVLMLDVALVVIYFILVRGVELPAATAPSGAMILTPSAGHETFWVMMTFVVYVVWDFVTKAVARDENARPQPSLWGRVKGPFWKRGRISIACAAIAFAAWVFLRGVTSVSAVLATDVGLLSLDLFFRAWKQGHTGWSLTTAALSALAFAAALAWS
jgi:hypothetical protein